jgi:hypothetical protein
MFLLRHLQVSPLDIQLSTPRPRACLDQPTNVPKSPPRITNVLTHLRTVKSYFSFAPTPGPPIYGRLKGGLRFPVSEIMVKELEYLSRRLLVTSGTVPLRLTVNGHSVDVGFEEELFEWGDVLGDSWVLLQRGVVAWLQIAFKSFKG